ncbi:MAG: twin-arginine translocase subunit TatC [Gemmataceae bacterium]|nr:twin-arginine translocase subunit TatC [Gemmataceae bacterium]
MSTNSSSEAPDPEDMFSETRMSFGDHIEELRSHLIRAIVGFVVGMVASLWPLGPWVLHIIVTPVENQLDKFEVRKVNRDIRDNRKKMENEGISLAPRKQLLRFDRAELRAAVGLPPNEPKEQPFLEDMMAAFEKAMVDLDAYDLLEDIARNKGKFVELQAYDPNPLAAIEQGLRDAVRIQRKRLSTMHITEAFMVYFKVSMMTGFVLSSPWVFYHIWMFIAAGLYPNEKRLVHVYLPFSLFLFISGVAICQFAVMPRAVEALLWFNEWLGMSPDLRLNEWLGFALMMPLVFGVSFQTPLVMMFFHKIGMLTVQTYRDYRRISWMVMAVFAAVITPSIDPWSMLLLWFPMGGLYELGILLCVYQGDQERQVDEEEESKSNELVEV